MTHRGQSKSSTILPHESPLIALITIKYVSLLYDTANRSARSGQLSTQSAGLHGVTAWRTVNTEQAGSLAAGLR